MVSGILFLLFRMSLFIFSIVFYLSYVKNVLWSSCFGTPLEELYDYIIVGGGTAGAVIAGRLAAYQGKSVLVLEAGGPPPTWDLMGLVDVPILVPLWHRSYFDWSYVTTPQDDACKGLHNSASYWPRGRLVGGSARLNNMIYLRGHFLDWDEWEKAGGPDWGRQNMLQYFMKSERQLGSYANDTAFHERSGWLPLSDSPITALGHAVLEGVRLLGFPVRDLNGARQDGFMRVQLTALRGSHYSPDKAFLNDDVKNLQVLTNAHVGKVLVDEKNEAYGVEFHHNGFIYHAKCRHGVVLSAGVIGSPQILMLSGIGPTDLLRSVNIPVIADLPVGQNLQDHVITGVDLVLLNTTLGVNMASVFNVQSAIDYVFEGKGPWTHGGAEVIGTWRSKRVSESEPPDLQLTVIPVGIASDGGAVLRHNVRIADKVWEGYFEPLTRRPDMISVTLGISLLHPGSRGEVSIQSSSPFDPPIIDPNYLADHNDVDTLIEGIEFVKRLTRTKPMLQLGAALNPRKVPGCKSLPFYSRRYWECYVRTLTLTGYHPVGTCRMGKSDDPNTVVDQNLRVLGIKNLYVADASIMPTIPSANTMAAVIAIAEKMADVLQKEREKDTYNVFSLATTSPMSMKDVYGPSCYKKDQSCQD